MEGGLRVVREFINMARILINALLTRWLQCLCASPMLLCHLQLVVASDTLASNLGSRELSKAQESCNMNCFAVGLHAGGPQTAEYVDAINSSYLSKFTQVVIMADQEDESRHIRPVPSKFYCSRASTFGSHISDNNHAWSSRGRCTQLRFLYLLLTIRAEFPAASYYILLDSDVFLRVEQFAKSLTYYNPREPWLMGTAGGPNPNFVLGSVLVLSRRIVEELNPSALIQCASHWEFACSFHGCCDGGQDCFDKTKHLFDSCNDELVRRCGSATIANTFSDCTARIEDLPQCELNRTRPEFPVPMYYHSERWNEHHGDDHWLSFCALTVGHGRLLRHPQFSKWRLPCKAMCSAGKVSTHYNMPKSIRLLAKCVCKNS